MRKIKVHWSKDCCVRINGKLDLIFLLSKILLGLLEDSPSKFGVGESD